MPTAEIVAQAVRLGARRRAVRPFRLDLGPSGDRRGARARSRARCRPRSSSMAACSRPTTGARFWPKEPHVDAIVRGEGEETARQLIAALERQTPLRDVRGIAYRGERPAGGDARRRSVDPRSRRLSRRLGADRPRALQLLGRIARRRRAVLARLSAPLQLLRPARLLDALASPRSGAVRARSWRGCIASTACA